MTARDDLATLPDADPNALPIASGRQAFRVVARLLRRRLVPLLLVVVTGLAAAAAGLVAPWMLGWLVDRLTATPRMSDVWTAVIAIGVAGVVAALAVWWGQRWLAAAAEPAIAELRESAVERALAIDSARIEAAGTGDLVSRVAEDSREVAESGAHIVPIVLQSLFAVLVTAAGLFTLDWRLGLAGLVAVPMYWLSLRWYLPRSTAYYTAERAAFAVRAGRLLGGVEGAETLRALGDQDRELDRITAASVQARDLSIDVFRFLTRFAQRNNRAEFVTLAVILSLGFLLVHGEYATAGAVTAAALLFHRMFNPIGALVSLFDEVQSAGASLVRVVGVQLAEPAGGRESAGDPVAGRLDVAVESHAYVPGQPVLQPVRLDLAPGTSTAVVGSTGAGKSTLAAIAAGVIDASVGGARLDGVDVRGLAPATLRRHISMVSQETHTFAGTVADNLRMGRADADPDELWRALDLVGAGRWVRELPDGMETVIGDGGHRITAMQAQVLALARVAVVDPAVVVLDEATAEAGSSGARQLDAAAAAVLAGRTSLVVAHRLSQASRADTIVVMAEGAVVEHGSHTELVAAAGRYDTLWRAWSEPHRS